MYKEKTLGDYIENSMLGSMGIYTGTPGNIIALENYRIAKQVPPFIPPYVPPPPPPPPIFPNRIIFDPVATDPAPNFMKTPTRKPIAFSKERNDPPLWNYMLAAYLAGMFTPFFMILFLR